MSYVARPMTAAEVDLYEETKALCELARAEAAFTHARYEQGDASQEELQSAIDHVIYLDGERFLRPTVWVEDGIPF